VAAEVADQRLVDETFPAALVDFGPPRLFSGLVASCVTVNASKMAAAAA